MKVAESRCAPADSTVPVTGRYAIVPATEELAFNCVELNAVPSAMAAGVAHVIAGVAFTTVKGTVTLTGE